MGTSLHHSPPKASQIQSVTAIPCHSPHPPLPSSITTKLASLVLEARRTLQSLTAQIEARTASSTSRFPQQIQDLLDSFRVPTAANSYVLLVLFVLVAFFPALVGGSRRRSSSKRTTTAAKTASASPKKGTTSSKKPSKVPQTVDIQQHSSADRKKRSASTPGKNSKRNKRKKSHQQVTEDNEAADHPSSSTISSENVPEMPPFSNKNQPDWLNEEDDDTLIVIWAGEKLRFKLPPPETPLSELRKLIAERTGVEPQYQKLIMGGAIMQKDLPLQTYGLVRPSLADKVDKKGRNSDKSDNDDLLPSLGIRDLLSKWGLGNTSLATGKKRQTPTIRLIGSKETSAVVSDRLPGNSSSSSTNDSRRHQQQEGSRMAAGATRNEELDEKRTIAKIDSLVNTSLEKLDEPLKKYLDAPPPTAAGDTSSTVVAAPLSKEESQKQHAYLSEILLQALLKLDSIEITNSDHTEARKFRKESIRKIQGILDQVDAVKERNSRQPAAAGAGTGQSNTVVR